MISIWLQVFFLRHSNFLSNKKTISILSDPAILELCHKLAKIFKSYILG